MINRITQFIQDVEKCDPNIYSNLAVHQRSEDWFAKDIAVVFQTWADRLNVEFKLQVPELAIRIDAFRRSEYGHFRYGHNGFGLKGEIGINVRYLQGQRLSHEVLGTLLHELLHAWQQAHGKPGKRNYHNRQFRKKAESLGLLVDERGITSFTQNSPFIDLLKRHSIEVPCLPVLPPPVKLAGQSKMKKWSCGCTIIRCATTLDAVCCACGQEFRQATLSS